MDENILTKRVIVGYDGSPPADGALLWAIDAAARTRAALLVVVAQPRLDLPGLPGRGQSLLDASGLADVAIETIDEPAARALREVAGASDLLVVGSLGHGRVAGTLVGSVSRSLVHRAPCPVVVVRPARSSSTDIVVGIDGSPDSILALSWACHRARTSYATVVALHGYRSGVSGGGLGAPVDGDLADHVVRAETRLRDWIDHAPILDAATVRAEAVALPPAELLVDASEHAGMVVVGARGRGAMPGVHLGSVADHVVARAHCPVAVVH